jgi:hypothetical protein
MVIIQDICPRKFVNESKSLKTGPLETKEKVSIKQDRQQIQLVKGAFSASEASDIICALLDEKINFHKLQRLKLWEGSHGCQTSQLDGRIHELEQEKRVAREFIARVRESGRDLKISGTLEITLAD